jgi:hypothetical protein
MRRCERLYMLVVDFSIGDCFVPAMTVKTNTSLRAIAKQSPTCLSSIFLLGIASYFAMTRAVKTNTSLRAIAKQSPTCLFAYFSIGDCFVPTHDIFNYAGTNSMFSSKASFSNRLFFCSLSMAS